MFKARALGATEHSHASHLDRSLHTPIDEVFITSEHKNMCSSLMTGSPSCCTTFVVLEGNEIPAARDRQLRLMGSVSSGAARQGGVYWQCQTSNES